MATETSVELETLTQDGSEIISNVPATTFEGLTNTSFVLPGPTFGVQSKEVPNDDAHSQIVPRGRSLIIITQLAGINMMTSFSNGVLTVGLPAIASSLSLPNSLLLWPSSAYALTSGTCLLLAGSLADFIGSKSVNLVGCVLLAVFITACGFANTGIQLIMFRAMQGIASSLVMPSSISIVSTSVERGRLRNIGFGVLGLAMPLGFSFGLVLGGVFVSGPGWRVGYYINGAISFLFFMVGIWALPQGIKAVSEDSIWTRLQREIDWVGAAMASISLALFSYVLAMLSSKVQNIKKPSNIVLLVVSLALILAFMKWMNRQEKEGRPVLIPNSIWKNRTFTSICVMILLSTAVMNCMELFSSLFFQEVQELSALDASIRILPNMLLGIVTNLVTGVFVNKVPAVYSVLISSGLCACAPLLMAVINPKWPYWYDAFFAQLLSPLSADVLFTIGIIVVADVFPPRTQALAGAVFNTVAQLGTSIGLTTMSVISVAVSQDSKYANKQSPGALMKGYRASFWTLFAWMTTACCIGAFGLRRLGKIGEKRD